MSRRYFFKAATLVYETHFSVPRFVTRTRAQDAEPALRNARRAERVSLKTFGRRFRTISGSQPLRPPARRGNGAGGELRTGFEVARVKQPSSRFLVPEAQS